MSTNWERSLEKRPLITGFGLTALAIVAVFVLGALAWGLATGFSYWWGQGDAYRQKNSSANWIAAQAGFHQEMNDVTGFKQKIALATQRLADFNKAHPNLTAEDGLVGYKDAQTRDGLTSDLTGLQQQCVNTVNQYNTDARSYLTEDWRDADLPESLDVSACG
jgi:hypothetical protein